MNCTTFQNQFGEIRAKMGGLESLIASFTETANPDLAAQFASQMQEVTAKKDDFFEQYKESVMEMLYRYSQDPTMKPIQIEDTGRVAVYRINAANWNHFPSIIRVTESDCQLEDSFITSADYLEEVKGQLFLNRTASSFKSLESVGWRLSIKEDIDFREVFPKLKEVGKLAAQRNARGRPLRPFYVKKGARNLIRQIRKEKEAGRLTYEGPAVEWWD